MPWSFNNPLRVRVIRLFRRRNLKRTLFRLGLGFFFFVVLLFAWNAKDLPTPAKIKAKVIVASTTILDREGRVLYAVSEHGERLIVEHDHIPDVARWAAIAAEDRRFYEHFGLDWRGIARAAYRTIFSRGQVIQGGSTITQQFIKGAILSPERTVSRKIKEVILALEIEALYSKDQILDFYLNTIPYGRNAYGIEAAAGNYFGKNAKDLTTAEAAILAALPQRPTYYANNPDDLRGRARWVIDGMVTIGKLSHEEATHAKEEIEKLAFVDRRESIQAPHFVFYILEQLEKKYGERLVMEGGLKVTTTLDLDVQRMAEEAVERWAERNKRLVNANNAAMVAINNKTGEILAMVGSRDYFNEAIKGQVNVTTTLQEPGSAFKPVVYAVGLEEGWSPGSTLWDLSTDFGGGYIPENYDGATRGPVSIRTALANSLNIPAVKMLGLVGLNNAIDQAEKMGITTFHDREKYGLSLVLGGGSIKLLELAGAYTAFPNGGIMHDVVGIREVRDSAGKLLEELRVSQGRRVLSEETAWQIADILSDNAARAPIFGSRSPLYIAGHTVGAKTGTTQSYRDAWTFMFTPSELEEPVTIGVWTGNTDNTEMRRGGAGAMAAAPIANTFMTTYLKSKPEVSFPRPDSLQKMALDQLTGKKPVPGWPTRVDWVAPWQIPDEDPDFNRIYRVNKLDGLLATDACPEEVVEERRYRVIHSEDPKKPNWEAPVRAWAAAAGFDQQPPTEYTTLCDPTRAPNVSLTEPDEGETVSNVEVIRASAAGVNGIARVEFALDGVVFATATSPPYETTYDFSSFANGTTHTVTAIAFDTVGLKDTDSVNVTVNNLVLGDSDRGVGGGLPPAEPIFCFPPRRDCKGPPFGG